MHFKEMISINWEWEKVKEIVVVPLIYGWACLLIIKRGCSNKNYKTRICWKKLLFTRPFKQFEKPILNNRLNKIKQCIPFLKDISLHFHSPWKISSYFEFFFFFLSVFNNNNMSKRNEDFWIIIDKFQHLFT